MSNGPDSRPAFVPPFVLSQDLSLLTSLTGLQEIVKTYREVIERNDKAMDALLFASEVQHVIDRSRKQATSFEEPSRQQMFIETPRMMLGRYIRDALALMSALGIEPKIDVTQAESDLWSAVTTIQSLRGVYNKSRFEQSDAVAGKIRDALGKLESLADRARDRP